MVVLYCVAFVCFKVGWRRSGCPYYGSFGEGMRFALASCYLGVNIAVKFMLR
jgi:hypothetical protein